ncbi:MAG: hypothetical protein GX383_11865 [Clostridium sp.]|jgi:hypothetical protein|nr:hypothetical protein [Clostridium sp.]
MKGVANSILAVVLVSFFVLSFTNFLLFFPWYLTLIYNTFNVATEASIVNYVTSDMVENVISDLESKPLYKDHIGEVKVYMNNVEVKRGVDNPALRLQKGQTFSITIKADFPFVVKIFGNEFERKLPIRFTIPSTGVRYYKDMDPYAY